MVTASDVTTHLPLRGMRTRKCPRTEFGSNDAVKDINCAKKCTIVLDELDKAVDEEVKIHMDMTQLDPFQDIVSRSRLPVEEHDTKLGYVTEGDMEFFGSTMNLKTKKIGAVPSVPLPAKSFHLIFRMSMTSFINMSDIELHWYCVFQYDE